MPERRAFIIGARFLHKIFIRKQEKDKNGEKEPVQPQDPRLSGRVGFESTPDSDLLRIRKNCGLTQPRKPSFFHKKRMRDRKQAFLVHPYFFITGLSFFAKSF
jgi:hypothetical protein